MGYKLCIRLMMPAVLAVAASPLYSQSFPECRFSNISRSDGLPTNLTTVILKDRRGLVWIGTESSGLLRYDGRQVKSYYNPAQVSDGHISSLAEDAEGFLWVGTLNGLYRVDAINGIVKHYRHLATDPHSPGTNDKPHPYIDSRGRLWVAGDKGLQLYVRSADHFIYYTLPKVQRPAWELHQKDISFVYEDAAGSLWAGSSYGLYQLDSTRRSMKPFFTGSYLFTTAMLQDNYKQYWVAFWGGGLKQFSPQTGLFTDIPGLPSIILRVKEWKDAAGHYWLVLLEPDGIVLFDPLSRKHKRYLKNDPATLLSGSVLKDIFIDQEQRIWVTGNAGVNILDNALRGFRVIKLGHEKAGLALKDKEPKALLKVGDRYLIASWYADGLYEFDLQWKFQKHINAVPPASTGILSRSVYRMQEDPEGAIWYCTDSGLVRQYGKNYQVFLPQDEYALIDEQYAARQLLEQKNGEAWVVFLSRGVYRFNKKTGRFGRNYRHQFNGDAVEMAEDKKGGLWLFSRQGIYRYNEPADSFVKIILQVDPLQLPDHTAMYQVFFDSRNIAWIASIKGLIRFDPATAQATLIRDPLRGLTQSVSRLLQDSTGTIWMESVSELIAYEPARNRFRYFQSSPGLVPDFMASTNVFNWVDSSTIAVGNIGSLTLFQPYQFNQGNVPAALVVTDIEADDQRQVQGSPQWPSMVRLPSAASKLLIHFSYLSFTATASNKLYYRFKRKNEHWIESRDGDILLYNLPYGEYELELKGINSAGFSKEIVQSFLVIIDPQWYQTRWFKFVLVFLLAYLVYRISKLRAKTLKKQLLVRQRIAETEMAALKAQMNPHFLFNCINSIDAFIQTNDKYHATVYLNKFAKLLRNVLDSSKENLVLFSKDVETLRLYIELEELRSDHQFAVQMDVDESLLTNDYKVPPLIVQPFVENAILHGLRNKPGKQGLLKISIRREGNTIVYRIGDNGIGRARSALLNKGKQRSYGMQMSFDRIKLFNREEQPSVSIEDLYENGEPAGTLITAKLIMV